MELVKNPCHLTGVIEMRQTSNCLGVGSSQWGVCLRIGYRARLADRNRNRISTNFANLTQHFEVISRKGADTYIYVYNKTPPPSSLLQPQPQIVFL